jgi:hypothetical protein
MCGPPYDAGVGQNVVAIRNAYNARCRGGSELHVIKWLMRQSYGLG